MSGTHPNAMRQRDERAHPVVQDAVNGGYEASGADYIVPGLRGHAAANEARLSIGRALSHFGFAKAARVIDSDGRPCYKNCADPAALHGVSFRLISKESARSHIVYSSGGNAANLKYNPFARGF